jgi:DNA-binding transcriptional LysR family regulator
MRIEQLEYLAAVVQHGSMRRASEQLHLSQPALSESIRSLEKELGVLLLDRRRTGARISQQGRELLPQMAEILDATAQLRAIAGGRFRAAPALRIGTVNAATCALLAPAIRLFTEQHHTSVDVVNVRADDVHRGLDEGSLDIGLVNVLPGDDIPAGLHSTTLLQGRPAVVCRGDSELAAFDHVDAAALRPHLFVAMRSGYLMHRFAQRLFGGNWPPETISTDGAENGKALVAAGVGVTILPDYSVIGDPLETAGVLAVRPLAGIATPVSMLILRRATDRVPPSIQNFENTLVGLARDHPQGRWVAV